MHSFSMIPALMLLATLLPMLAKASMSSVGGARVDEGVLTLHWRNAYMADDENPVQDGQWRTRVIADYGFTDNYALALHVQGSRLQGDNLELDSVMMDHRFEIHDVETDGMYSALRFRYTWRDGDSKPDAVRGQLVLGAPYGNWDFRFNQILGFEVGQERRAGLLVDTRGQITYGFHPEHRVGFEQVSNFGNTRTTNGFDSQNHTIGPVLQGQFAPDVSYETGYRYGISDRATDHTIRLFLMRRF